MANQFSGHDVKNRISRTILDQVTKG